MNVLIVTAERGLDKGGMQLSCERFAGYLAESGKFRVNFLMSSDYPIATAKGRNNPMFEKVIMREYKLKTDAKSHKDTDLVIAFGGKFNGYYASLLAEKIGCRFIIFLRGSDTYTVKWSEKNSWYFREAARRADKITCLSQEMYEDAVSLCPESAPKISIIPNPLRLSPGHEVAFPNLPAKIRIGCAASAMTEKKGILNMLYVLAEFRQISDTPITFEVVGRIEDYLAEQYEETAKRLGVTDNIIFSGWMSRESLREVMLNWDFYVQGSVCEGQSNALGECIQAERGFIMSDTGFLAELLRDDFPEIVFSSWEPGTMARELDRLVRLDGKEELYRRAKDKIMIVCGEESVKTRLIEFL